MTLPARISTTGAKNATMNGSPVKRQLKRKEVTQNVNTNYCAFRDWKVAAQRTFYAADYMESPKKLLLTAKR